MDPYSINMMLGTSVANHISLLHASMIAHMQDPLFDFYSVTILTHRLLWFLPIVTPWVEFRIRFYDFIVTRALGWDGRRIHAKGK